MVSIAMAHPDGANGPAALQDVSRQADGWLLLALCGSGVAALLVSLLYDAVDVAVPLGLAAILLPIAALAVLLARGSLLSQTVLTVCHVLMVVVHIHLARGDIEMHFGVFVLLAVLMVYRSRTPILLAAVLFAAHHVLFDRLQALGLPVYCTPQADLAVTLSHAVYVVVQTGVELVLARQLRRAAIESAELTAIVHAVDGRDALCLDMTQATATGPVARMLKGALLKIDAALQEVRVAAQSVEDAARDIAMGNQDLSQRTERQAGNLQATAAAMSALAGQVQLTADNADHADSLVRTAAEVATHGGDAMQAVVTRMAAVAEAAARIGAINAVVDGLAFQSNVLALNAAVEAAHAGEHGRGFSVVASEVRSLARRTAEAALEIRQLIDEGATQVRIGTELAGGASACMTELVAQVQRMSTLIGHISSATRHQTQDIGAVDSAVRQLDSGTQQNAALVEESAAAAESLQRQAVQLNAVVNRFELSTPASSVDV
ncbi:MAG: chemotaxis protein [Burkholderiales bacterium PBB6]|nr:MAG: chemotaxis protein [Burkholderiales bacterium PBB6]